jgi:hypothetical protein
MPVNVHPDYVAAEQEYLNAETKEQKIRTLKRMISLAPSHKGAENLRAQLKRRLAKLKYTKEKEAKVVKSSKKGIKKAEMQAVIIGLTNSGKSTLLSLLTNASPKIAEHEFTTTSPVIGILNYQGCQIQLIEIPAIGSEYYDKGLVHTADVLLILINKLKDLEKILPLLHSQAKRIIIFNIKDETDKRKISATLQSKKYNFVIINLKTKQNLDQLKEKIFTSFDNIRVYTKEPGKPKSEKPIILQPGSTVKDVAEKIFHGFSKQVRETRVTGPSSKFPNQKTGLSHILKDLDVVEFKTR